MIDCDCPRCGSRNTKALAVLHSDGTKDAHYRRNGWFYYRRSFGLHSSTTRGRTQSLIAQHAAPPVPTSTRFLVGGGVPVTLILGAMIGGSAGFLVGLGLLVAIAVIGGWSDGESHGQRTADWSSTFRCGRCGTVFAVFEAAPSQEGSDDSRQPGRLVN